MEQAEDFFAELNRAVAEDTGYTDRFFDLPFPLIGDLGTEIAYDDEDLRALHGMDLARSIASGDVIYDWRIVQTRACGRALTLLRTEATLTPRGGQSSDPFYICRIVRRDDDGLRLAAMINPLAFSRTARGLPARAESAEEQRPVSGGVASLIREAAESFARGDLAAFRRLCDSPVVWIADAGTLVMDDTNFEEGFRALHDIRVTHGGDKPFDFAVESETPYGDALILVRSRVDMSDRADRPLDPFYVEFILRQTREGRRLAGMINTFGGRFWPTV